MTIRRFPVLFTGINRAMVLLGLTARNSYLEINGDAVEVRMGWAFRATFPTASISEVVLDHRRVFGWGVHGWGGRWLVNGSSKGIVRIQVDPKQRARLMTVIPVSLRELRISVAEPDTLILALRSADTSNSDRTGNG